jgi:hypothetical protein
MNIRMGVDNIVDVMASAARYEWLKKHPLNAGLIALLPVASWDRHIDGQMSYTVPTMAEQAEEELSEYKCRCGDPMKPGWLHSTDKVCYQVGSRRGE